jgi:glycosyltransferase involved in cell wall biosynthesis
VLAGARSVAYLTPRERDSLTVVSRGRARLEELANGVPAGAPARPQATPHVLYLARLAPRKRPVAFVQAAAALAAEFPAARFTLLGPDEGEGDAVRAAIAASGHADRIRWDGPVAMEASVEHMRDASVYVLPSVDEPYPMSVLEAMSVGLPVVVTDTCGLAPFVTEHDAGVVVDDTVTALTAALRGLLADPAGAAARGARAAEAVRAHRSMTAIAERLESLYR